MNCTYVEHVAEVFRCCSAVLATLVATAEQRRQIELPLVYAASGSADRCYTAWRRGRDGVLSMSYARVEHVADELYC